MPGPEGGELIQHIPAHGVDGGGRESQPRFHLSLHTHTAVGSAAGLTQAVGNGLAGDFHIPGNLRLGTCHDAAAALGIRDFHPAALGCDNGFKGDIDQRGFTRLVGLAGGLDPGRVVLGLLPDTEHIPVHPAGVVAVGKALTVKGGHQNFFHTPGHLTLVQGLAVGCGDGGHVFGLLHPALQLDGGHAHLLQLLQIVHQAVVLQAQGVLVLPVGVAVALAAGLGAAAPVAGTAADHGRHITLAAVAHAQCAMGKNLNFNGGVGADVADLLPAQFPAQHHPAHAPGGAEHHPGQGVDRHLGGAVEGHMGGDLTAQLHHAQILDDEGIHAAAGGVADGLTQLGDLLVGDQGI